MSRLKPKKNSVTQTVENVTGKQNIDRMSDTHFSGVMNSLDGNAYGDNVHTPIMEHTNNDTRHSVTVRELSEAAKLSKNNVPGADKIPAEVYKYDTNSLLSALAHFFTRGLK